MTLHEFCTPFGRKRSEYADGQLGGECGRVVAGSFEGRTGGGSGRGRVGGLAKWLEAEGRTFLQFVY